MEPRKKKPSRERCLSQCVMAVMALNDADAILIGVLVICMVPRMSVIRFLEPAAGDSIKLWPPAGFSIVSSPAASCFCQHVFGRAPARAPLKLEPHQTVSHRRSGF